MQTDETLEGNGSPAFYSLRNGAWRDYVTLLHPPYTLWHLSYVVLGAAVAPALRLDRLGYALLAFFLAVGVAAHSLDELKGRPLKTRIPSSALWTMAAVSAAGAVSIGIYGTFVTSAWMWVFVAFGAFILAAYNLELFGGRFHSDFWFALSWGAFPFVVTYWVCARRLNVPVFLLASACFGLSFAQRKLSTQARMLRRKVVRAGGGIEYKDGTKREISKAYLLELPEVVLRILAVTVVVLAVGLLAARL